MARAVGETVAGLTLLSELGETRAATLFLGECDDGRCLVKVLRDELCGDRERVERAFAAARTVGELDHRGIEFVIEAGWDGDTAYVLGDVVPGTSAVRLVMRRSLEADGASHVVQLAADALAAAHAVGVVHGALELLLVHVGFAADRVILRDFGVATLAREAGVAVAADDVRALGDVAAELLGGIRDVPDAVTALVARMQADDPASRPTAADVRDELDRIARGAANVAIAETAIASRRRAPTAPPDGAPRAEPAALARPSPPPGNLAAMLAPPRLARATDWRCERCREHNARGRAFCLHCGAPATAPRDVSSVMATLLEHASDEQTAPPGPPPSPPSPPGAGDDDDHS